MGSVETLNLYKLVLFRSGWSSIFQK